jgi:serine/threonine protein kinase/Tfp pilus assembly protein PilF
MNELDIFSAAVALDTPEEREKYLDEACGDNAALRERIDSLLRSFREAGSFIESPAHDFENAATLDRPVAEGPGTIIGSYKILQQIGEGGMGVVFMAEQSEPIQRTVALKIIKPGMDTRQVIARFEAERQALAMMDHPNIAKVLDAGTTSSGRPFFVMELVKGVPITEYCDRQRLPVGERLKLMTTVCSAVQHAHHKGVIHRDIKPSNVLVAEYDGLPVPRIIDFGVAKAMGQQLTERTLFTQFGQIVGTFEYMSPEQSRFNQLDVDTRSDIYSLGVLLYELLAGSTPIERERLRTAAFDQILHMISDEEPPQPSVRIGSSESLPSIAANRGMEPKRLAGTVRGDLDWVVMKALEKDRSRRYDTASGLARDLEHFLADEPVSARPPSAAYRMRKFVRRNKLPFAAAIALATALIGGLGLSTWMYVKERAARERAVTAEEKSVQSLNLLKMIISGTGSSPGIQDPKLLQEVLTELGGVNSTVGAAQALNNLGLELRGRGRYDDAVTLLRQAQDVFQKIYRRDNQEIVTTYANLALTLWDKGQLGEAEQMARSGLEMTQRLSGPESLMAAKMLNDLGGILKDAGRLAEADEALQHALTIRKHERGTKHFETAETTFHLASLRRKQGKLAEAEGGYRESLRLFRGMPISSDLAVVGAQNELATVLLEEGKFDEAEKLARDSRKIYDQIDPENSSWQTFYARSVLGGALLGKKNYVDAAPLLQSAYEGMLPQKAVVPKHYFAEVVQRLIEYAEATGNAKQAEVWRQKLVELGDPKAPRGEVASRPEGHNAGSKPALRTNRTRPSNDTVSTVQHKESPKQP